MWPVATKVSASATAASPFPRSAYPCRSLHAPNDEIRTQIVPTNKSTGLADILAAADRYFAASGRRLTFEYVLLAEINDRPEHAQELVELLQGRTMLLNVIPYNPVAGLPYKTPSGNAVNRFRDILISGGINVKFRQRKGSEIDAACGQLRRSTPMLQQLEMPIDIAGLTKSSLLSAEAPH
jgi:23S rRNA (adenine2503-C2)-methyltransferase